MPDYADPELQARRRASLVRVQKLAYWLDDAFRVPVVGNTTILLGLAATLVLCVALWRAVSG